MKFLFLIGLVISSMSVTAMADGICPRLWAKQVLLSDKAQLPAVESSEGPASSLPSQPVNGHK